MSKKKPEPDVFRTVADMHRVPIEKLDAFTTDLRLWLQAHRLAELRPGHVRIASPTDAFGWIDDGKHDVRVKVTFQQP